MRRTKFYIPFFIGLSDGLVVPFAFIAGLSNVMSESSDIVPIIAGIAIFSAGLMSFGGYFTIRNEVSDHSANTEKQRDQVKAFYANIGLPEEMQTKAADEILADREVFETASEREELPVSRAGQSALLIGISYILAAIGTFFPLLFINEPIEAFKFSAIITIPLLFVSSFVRFRLKNTNAWLGAIQHTIIGILAGLGGFLVGFIVG